MKQIDRDHSIRQVTARLEATEDPRHRHMLEILLSHLVAERDLSLDGLMGSLGPDPVYRFWRDGRDSGPKGRDAVAEYYTGLVAARRGVLEYALDRIVVDDATIVTEGVIRAYYPGRSARDFGFEVDELDATYLVVFRAVILWPFDEQGQMLGEEGYVTFSPTDAERVDRDELPDAYVSQFTEAELAAVGL